jgi:hypothetical protein
MKKLRKWAFWIRLSVLVPALAGTFVLYRWNQRNDPRFYLFLSTPAGRQLAGLFRWYAAALPPREADKLDEAYTPDELQTKRALESDLAAMTPTTRLVLADGRRMVGRIVEEQPDAVLFEENYGPSGTLAMRVRRNRIQELTDLREPVPPVTYRDVLFKQEFPAFSLYKRVPYTVLTDEKFFQVEGAVRVLQKLHRDFLETFQPLLVHPPRADGIQVLFFSREDMFRRYQRKYAPRMDTSVGFYSPWADRFIVFNQRNSEFMASLGHEVEQRAGAFRERPDLHGDDRRIEEWKQSAGRRMDRLAELQTQETIRHEGAHQLFFTYGVHSAHRIENEWLYEGLAVYCETVVLGGPSPQRAVQLQDARHGGRLIPLADLVNHRSTRGLFSFGASEQVELAYSQSWALVRYLMQPERRPVFFEFLGHLRDRRNFWPNLKEPQFDMLCRFLGRTPAELESDWLRHLERM